jgi:hypothetical protein
MDSRTLIGLLFAMLLGTSGCAEQAGEPSPSDGPRTTESTATATSSSTVTGVPVPVPADAFDWSACSGLGLGLVMPTPLFDAPRPRDWSASQDNSAVAGSLLYAILTCERVSWGPFERGPVALMLEWHNDFEAPAKCAEGDFMGGMILSALWFDDADLASYARDQFGMPAQVAEIDYTISPTADLQTAHATWKLPGGELSEAFMHERLDFMFTDETNWRVFWDNGVGVSYFNIHLEYDTPQESLGVAYGTLAPPMLYGTNMPDSRFETAGQTDLMLDGDVSAEISRFGDLQCGKPL